MPALVESIKVAGLVLVKNMAGRGGNGETAAATASNTNRPVASTPVAFQQERDGVDGILRENGVLRFYETIDM